MKFNNDLKSYQLEVIILFIGRVNWWIDYLQTVKLFKMLYRYECLVFPADNRMFKVCNIFKTGDWDMVMPFDIFPLFTHQSTWCKCSCRFWNILKLLVITFQNIDPLRSHSLHCFPGFCSRIILVLFPLKSWENWRFPNDFRGIEYN